VVDKTINYVKSLAASKFGVLGLGLPTDYMDKLEELSIPYIDLPENLMSKLNKSIHAVMEGRIQKEDEASAANALNCLFEQGAGKIILGCTEISFLIPNFQANKNLIDPLSILANVVVREAIS
jgi:aspartate/glutamate racemase